MGAEKCRHALLEGEEYLCASCASVLRSERDELKRRIRETLQGVATKKLDDDDETFCFCPTHPEDYPCLDKDADHYDFCEKARAILRELMK